MFQPLSLGDSFIQEEMKRLSRGKSVSSLFFPLLKKVPFPGLTELQLQKLNYQIHAKKRCLFNLIIFNHSVDNLYGTLRNILRLTKKTYFSNVHCRKGIMSVHSHLQGLFLRKLTRLQSQ